MCIPSNAGACTVYFKSPAEPAGFSGKMPMMLPSYRFTGSLHMLSTPAALITPRRLQSGCDGLSHFLYLPENLISQHADRNLTWHGGSSGSWTHATELASQARCTAAQHISPLSHESRWLNHAQVIQFASYFSITIISLQLRSQRSRKHDRSLFPVDGAQLKCSAVQIHTDFTFSLSSTGLMLSGANWFGLLARPAVGVTDRDMGAISTDTH